MEENGARKAGGPRENIPRALGLDVSLKAGRKTGKKNICATQAFLSVFLGIKT